jgi:hypothetical protein
LGITLALAGHLGRLVRRDGRGLSIVNSTHVVAQIPVTRETMAWHTTLTSSEGAEEWLLAVTVHGMSFALMTEETGCRRELCILAGFVFAAVRLQVRVDEFAKDLISETQRGRLMGFMVVLVVALEFLWSVIAS